MDYDYQAALELARKHIDHRAEIGPYETFVIPSPDGYDWCCGYITEEDGGLWLVDVTGDENRIVCPM